MTIEQLQALRESLKEALYSGTLTIRDGEKSVTFRSSDEIRRNLADVEAEIAAVLNPRRVSRIVRAVPVVRS